MNRFLWMLLLASPLLAQAQVPSISFDTTHTYFSEQDVSGFIWVRIDQPVAVPTSVELQPDPGSNALAGIDYVIPNGDVVFQPGGPMSLPVEILILDDGVPDNSVYLGLNLVNFNNADPGAYTQHVVLFGDDDLDFSLPLSAYELELLSSTRTDTLSNVVAQIAAYDPASKRLFVTNNAQNTIEILNLSDPLHPEKFLRLALTPYGGNVNSVAVHNGVFAVPVEAIPYTDPGQLVFFDPDGNFISQVTVGAFPKMVTFTPDGNRVLVANEGRPVDDYSLDPEGSVSIVSLSSGVSNLSQANVATVGFSAFNGQAASLRAAGVRLFGPGATVAQDLEPEHITFSTNGQKAFVVLQENNAYAVINLLDNSIEAIRSFGMKDWSGQGVGLDASDQAGGLFFQDWPVHTLMQPHAIASFNVNGEDYLIGSCEGEIREYNALNEDKRIGDPDFILDPQVFPDADLLKHPALLGRLVVTTIDGDLDNDGDYDELIGFGGRSIAIWKASTGELIWDSGDEMEKVTALDPDFGALFNANFNNTIFQNRSDDKGPEPEGIFLQELPTGERLAFVSMERTGGILVYDLQDPFEPKLLEYVNTRSLDSLGGDLGTEGLLFIPKNESPNGTHLLVACHEVSGTVAVFEVHVDKILTGEYDKDTFLLNTNPIGIYNGFSVYEGGISGLAYHKGTWKMLSDRGPVLPAYNNPLADGNNAAVFPFPAYSPKLWTFQENGSALQITNLQTLRKPDNSSFRGVPPPNGFGGTGEIPWATPNGIVLNNDIWGIDPEGMAIDNEDGVWVCDEYGTAIWHLNKDLIAQKRYTPTPFQSIDLGVNPILAKRQANAGFSGIAYTPNGKVYSILERPLANPDTSTGNQSYIHRILEIDPESGATRMFAYVAQKAGQGSSARAHLGGIAAINNDEFLVMEYLDYGHQVDRKIYTINLNGASEITGDNFNGLTLEQLVDVNGLGIQGIQPVQKHLLVDLYELAWNPNLKHPEGIAVVDARTIALINDNQYGIYSPNADGQAIANWEPTVLYKYTLPESQALDYVSPYCTLELGDTLTACINGSLELDLSGFGFMNGNWSDGQQGNVASFSQEGWFSVLAENPVGCKSRDSFYVHFETMLPVYLGVDTSICPGTSITLDAFQEDADVYLWSNGMLTPQIEVELPGTYTVTISSTAGCTGTDQVEVSFLIPPLPTIGMDAAICPGQTVLLGDEAPGWTYSWSCGAESAFILADSAGFYALTVTDAFGCTGMDAVVVSGLPAPDIDLGPDIPVCANELILLQAGNTSDLIFWSDGSAGTELEALAGGSYSVTVTNSMGCSSTDAITLYAVAAPVFDLGPDTLICAGDSLWLGVDIPGGYTWSTGSAASHIRVFTEGWYSLTVLNTFGCEASDSIYVDIESCTSSSEDQINSSWGIYPNPGTGVYQINWPDGIIQANCIIRNSLGEVILEKHSLKPGDWLHLEEWPSGMYVVELVSKNGLKFQTVLIHQGH